MGGIVGRWAGSAEVSSRTPPGNADLHERVGRGAYGEAAAVLVSGLDLSTGKTGPVVGAEGGSPRRNARIPPRE